MEASIQNVAGSDGDASRLSIHAGFPNPATDRSGAPLSLDRLLIRHPSSTYFFRIRGSTWEELGIFDSDIAIIDRALSPRRSDLVLAWQSDNFRLQHWRHWRQDVNPWGTVTSIIHPYGR